MIRTSPLASNRTYRQRSVVLLALFALLSSLLVVVAPASPAAATDGPIQIGEGERCVEFYFEYTSGDVDHYLVCADSQGELNEVSRDGSHGIQIDTLHAKHLHISCSDEYSNEVWDEDSDPAELLGFDSDHNQQDEPQSDLDGLLVDFEEDDGDFLRMFRIEKVVHPGSPDPCGDAEFPDPSGSLTLAKDVTGDAPDDVSFTFSVECEEHLDGEFTLPVEEDGADVWEWTFSNLPVGTTCDIEETDAGGADDTSFEVDGGEYSSEDGVVTVTIPDGAVTVTFTNHFPADPPPPPPPPEPDQVGSLDVSKTVTGDAVGDEAFAFTVDCGDVLDESFELGHGDVGEFTGIDVGTECTITEDEASGADSTTISVSGDDDAVVDVDARSATVTITEEGVSVAVAFTNAFVELNPDIELVKQADVEEAEVGDEITYTYTVINTGDTTLSDVTLDDDVLGQVELESTTLEAGGSTNGTAVHVVTEDDLEAGEVHNVAVVVGWPPTGEAVSDTDDATVDVFEQLIFPGIVDPAPEEEEEEEALPETGADTGVLLLWALIALALGIGVLHTTPRRAIETT